jgi:hypothetical protein
MKQTGFPGCCSAQLLVSLERAAAVAPNEYYPGVEVGSTSKENILALLQRANHEGFAFVSLTTNDFQYKTNEILVELGFLSSDWMTKKIHSPTRVKLWWFPLDRLKVS